MRLLPLWLLTLGILWSAGYLPWAPDAGAAKTASIGMSAAAAFGSLLWLTVRIWSNKRKLAITAGLLGTAVTAMSLWVAVLQAWGGMWVTGEELRGSWHDKAHGRTLFVYVLTELPDGDSGTRIAVRNGIWPLERTLVRTDWLFRELSEQDENGTTLLFRGGAAARYRSSDGTLEWLNGAQP